MSPARSGWVRSDAGGSGRSPVPVRALLLSAAALAVPLAAEWLAPGIGSDQLGILLWLPALLPAFLLTYYRGWRGASTAIAAGMAALTVTQVAISARRSGPPDWPVLLGGVVVLMTVSLGIGWVGELLHRARRQAERDALTDPLTGLPNRRHLGAYLEAAYAAAERGGRMTVVLFDIDGFRGLNASQGPDAGDAVLRTVARIVVQRARRLDLTARLGGDEFLTVLTGSGAGDAMAFVESVRTALAEERFPWGSISVSAGVAAHGRGVASPDALVAEADRAVRSARELGGGQGVVWEAGAQGAQSLLAGELEGFGDRVPTEAGGARSSSGGRGRLIVVQNDLDPLEDEVAMANRLGFEVDAVTGGEELLECLRVRAPDIVLSDLVMPGMSGFALSDRIADEHPGVPVLLVSRYDHQGLATDRRPASVVGFLRRPIEVRELGVALEQALVLPRGTPRRGVRAV